MASGSDYLIECINTISNKNIRENNQNVLLTITGKIINVVTLLNGNRTARVQLSGSNTNGSEDLLNIPITTSQIIAENDNVLLAYYGGNLKNSFIIALIKSNS